MQLSLIFPPDVLVGTFLCFPKFENACGRITELQFDAWLHKLRRYIVGLARQDI